MNRRIFFFEWNFRCCSYEASPIHAMRTKEDISSLAQSKILDYNPEVSPHGQ
jgi:hypothetical protein